MPRTEFLTHDVVCSRKLLLKYFALHTPYIASTLVATKDDFYDGDHYGDNKNEVLLKQYNRFIDWLTPLPREYIYDPASEDTITATCNVSVTLDDDAYPPDFVGGAWSSLSPGYLGWRGHYLLRLESIAGIGTLSYSEGPYVVPDPCIECYPRASNSGIRFYKRTFTTNSGKNYTVYHHRQESKVASIYTCPIYLNGIQYVKESTVDWTGSKTDCKGNNVGYSGTVVQTIDYVDLSDYLYNDTYFDPNNTGMTEGPCWVPREKWPKTYSYGCAGCGCQAAGVQELYPTWISDKEVFRADTDITISGNSVIKNLYSNTPTPIDINHHVNPGGDWYNGTPKPDYYFNPKTHQSYKSTGGKFITYGYGAVYSGYPQSDAFHDPDWQYIWNNETSDPVLEATDFVQTFPDVQEVTDYYYYTEEVDASQIQTDYDGSTILTDPRLQPLDIVNGTSNPIWGIVEHTHYRTGSGKVFTSTVDLTANLSWKGGGNIWYKWPPPIGWKGSPGAQVGAMNEFYAVSACHIASQASNEVFCSAKSAVSPDNNDVTLVQAGKSTFPVY